MLPSTPNRRIRPQIQASTSHLSPSTSHAAASPRRGLVYTIPHTLDITAIRASGSDDEDSNDLGDSMRDLESFRMGSMKGKTKAREAAQAFERQESEPPSFERSEFETIVRRLRTQGPGTLKRTKFPSDALAGGFEADDDFEFAGWGATSYISLPPAPPLAIGELDAHKTETELLGEFRATSVAGNACFGSVFYSMPSICAVALTLSPLSMLVACVILLLWRGIMVELAGAMRLNGANYVYLLNVSGKTMGLLGAAITLLDVIATGMVSAATAAAYIKGEVGLPFKEFIIAILIIVTFAFALLAGMRDSTRLTLTICIFHLLTMAVLMITSFVAWGKTGTAVLSANWTDSVATWHGGSSAARAVFNGICVGFLGVTGIECVPTYIEEVKPGVYTRVVRNLLYGAILLNVPLLLLVFALLPNAEILSSSYILSLLARAATPGRWLSIIVVIDAVIVLCGGVLCGGVACCGLLDKLATDKILPAVFLRTLPVTGSPWVSIGTYLILCLVFYATANFDLARISGVFSVSFMSVMFAFTISAFLVHHNVPHLPVPAPFHKTSLFTIVLAFGLMAVMIVGNIILTPVILLLLALYLGAIFGFLWIGQKWALTTRFLVWVLDHTSFPQLPTFLRRRTNAAGAPLRREASIRSRLRRALVASTRKAKRDEICAWVKDDEISSLIQVVLYVLKNEQTSKLILIHAYESVEAIPSELQANAKLLDEAFPALTIDLRFVQGSFGPSIVKAVSDVLEIAPSLHLIGCPLAMHGDLGAFGGARVIRS